MKTLAGSAVKVHRGGLTERLKPWYALRRLRGRRSWTASAIATLPLAFWILLTNYLSAFRWGHGTATFLALGSLVTLLLALRHVAIERVGTVRAADIPRCPPRLLLIVLLFGASAWLAERAYEGFVNRPDYLLDISLNTYTASSAFLDGHNPYAEPTQLGRKPPPGPHVEVDGTETRLFGVRYYHGHPYFPLMFLTYVPMCYFVDSYAAMRITNMVLLLANVLAVVLIIRRLIRGPGVTEACLLAVAAYLTMGYYAHGLFVHGTVDVLISTYALWGYYSVACRRDWAAGVLFGLAQSCKLLPGPLLVLPLLWVLWGQRRATRIVVGYLVTSLLVVGPFVAADPEAFLSATILFYLAKHAAGDDTALWFFLPRLFKLPFLIVGFGLMLVGATMLARPRSGRIVDAIAGSFCAYVIFMAFAKMTHLNYLWSILPLGAIALAGYCHQHACQEQNAGRTERLMRAR